MEDQDRAVASAEDILRPAAPSGARRAGIPVPPAGAYLPPEFEPRPTAPFNAGWLVEIGSRVMVPVLWWADVRDFLLETVWGRFVLFVIYAGLTVTALGMIAFLVVLYVITH